MSGLKVGITELLACKAVVVFFNENLIIGLKQCLPEMEEAINEICETFEVFSEEIDNRLLEAQRKEREEKRMTINEYQEAALRTANMEAYKNDTDMLLNGILGLTGESGECSDMIKKHLYQGHSIDREHLVKELGDIAWYLAVSANALGYDLESVLQMNVDKLKKRYPEGFSVERSLHRKEDDV